jgi:hypothetical protein
MLPKKAQKPVGWLYLTGLLVIIAWLVWYSGQEKDTQGKMLQFASAYDYRDTGHVPQHTYLRPKTLILNSGKSVDGTTFHNIDFLQDKFATDQRARKVEEIGSVVWLDCDTYRVGTYSNGGGTAGKTICDVRIVDVTLPALVGVKRFAGSDPPGVASVRTPGGGALGSDPRQEILVYLETLPSR